MCLLICDEFSQDLIFSRLRVICLVNYSYMVHHGLFFSNIIYFVVDLSQLRHLHHLRHRSCNDSLSNISVTMHQVTPAHGTIGFMANPQSWRGG
jgi:hypothetical protein